MRVSRADLTPLRIFWLHDHQKETVIEYNDHDEIEHGSQIYYLELLSIAPSAH